VGTSQTDRANQTGEQRYRHLFEHMPVCIFVADLTVTPAIILDVNRRTELVYGYTAAELIGMPAAQLAPDDARPTLLSIVKRVQQGETVTIETSSQHRDGTCFPVRVIAAPDPTNDGRMIVTVEDITAERQRRSEAEAIDAERRRIAHEIHDGVAQNLAGLRLNRRCGLIWLMRSFQRAALDEMQTVLNAAIADLRRAIFALRPVGLESLGFFPALTQLVGDFGDQYQVAARLEIAGPQEALPVGYELPLYRIIQESLGNIGQHAHATSALVRLDVDAAGGVAVSVRDDGCSFDPGQLGPTDQAGHFGLRQMRERVLDLHGALDIHSTLGQGTELIITLPAIARKVNNAQNSGAGSAQNSDQR
jgi:PAS domain S-box-containing protein